MHDTVYLTVALTGFCWYLVLWAIILLGAFSAYRFRPKFLLNYTPIPNAPGVSILRPLKGLDPNLYSNLESTFRQDYPKFEILFSVASAQDQALPVVRDLLRLYPNVKARLIIGEEVVGVNPKVNNLVPSYRKATYDILWIIDSNVMVDPGTLARAVDILTSTESLSHKPIGLIHHVPFVSIAGSFWGSKLEAAFLNATHAKMYIAINTVAIESCVVGKSNLYRRSDLERVNGSLKPPTSSHSDDGQTFGLPAFGRFLAEDNMIASALWHELDLRHDLSSDVAHNVVGNMTFLDYIWRRVRWIRVRKHMVLLATIVEPFTESVLLSIVGSASAKYLFGFYPWIFILIHFIIWLVVDLDVYRSLAGQRISVNIGIDFIMAWILRELLTLPIWIFAVCGNTVVWRGQRYQVLRNSEVRACQDGPR